MEREHKTEAPQPYLVAVNLTRRCNLACDHCYLDADRRSVPAPGELSSGEFAALFREIGARAPGTILVLTGGEPLLRPDLEELVLSGAEAGLRMVLGTNGVLLTRERALRLKAAGLEGAGISLDAVSAQPHDDFRGMSGAFAASCRAVRVCLEAGLHAQIHFTVTRANRHQIGDAVEMAKSLGAGIINFFFLVCVGRGESRMDLTAAEYEESLRQIAVAQKSAKGILVQSRCTPHFKRILHQANPEDPFTRATGYDGGGCPAGTHYCRITPTGEMTPCPYMELSGGNIRERGFWNIWEQAPLFHSLRNPGLLQGRCGGCEYRDICGGCRARALVSGNLMGEDPSCDWIPAGGPVIPSAVEDDFPLRTASGNDEVEWTPEALERLRHIPIFLRKMVRRKLEERARGEDGRVTPELMARHRQERERDLGIKFK